MVTENGEKISGVGSSTSVGHGGTWTVGFARWGSPSIMVVFVGVLVLVLFAFDVCTISGMVRDPFINCLGRGDLTVVCFFDPGWV